MTGDCPYSKYKQCVNVSDCRDSGQCWINFYLDKACSALNKNQEDIREIVSVQYL